MHTRTEKELSPYAPKMASMTIDVEKIAEVIGAEEGNKEDYRRSQCEIEYGR